MFPYTRQCELVLLFKREASSEKLLDCNKGNVLKNVNGEENEKHIENSNSIETNFSEEVDKKEVNEKEANKEDLKEISIEHR